MSQKAGSGLKAPTKIGRPSALSKPATGLQNRAQNALEKSARGAGLPSGVAEQYAAQLAKQFPGPASDSAPIDDYQIADRVFVGGTKAGIIAFIGETQFAPGEWAGVVLDNPVGKNDGSVAGVRYFQCEAKRGVFSRCGKLSKTFVEGGLKTASPPGAGDVSGHLSPPAATPAKPHAKPAAAAASANGTGAAVVPKVPAATPKVGATPKTSGLAKKGSISGSQSNLARTPHGSTSNLSLAGELRTLKHNLQVGDRVLVSGSKVGVLRYVGNTEFAKGEWAGVELDEAMGKNDGTVAGTRYFECKPMYGLFAPVHKVCKPLGPLTQTPRRASVTKYGGLSRERSGSQDSVSSIGSTASTASRSRATKTGSPRTGPHNLPGTTAALQKAMKEKEEHIEQLLRERDLERSEVARAAAQTDEVEALLTQQKGEYERYAANAEEQIAQLKSLFDSTKAENRQLGVHLEEEKRKVEDLQFSMEEAVIDKDDLERETELDSHKFDELKSACATEKERASKLESELAILKAQQQTSAAQSKDIDDSTEVYMDQIEELTHKLSQAESKLKEFQSEKQAQGNKTNQINEELSQHIQRETELEAQLAAKAKEVKGLQSKLTDAEDELRDSTSRRETLQNDLDDLCEKLASEEFSKAELEGAVQDLKSRLNDLERQLEASTIRSNQLEEDKTKLEHQISELMRNSGDSSQQLSLLNDQLIEKDRKQADLQVALSDSTQSIGKLKETIERRAEEGRKELEAQAEQHKEHLKTSQGNLEQAKSEIDKLNTKLVKSKEDFEQEKTDLTAQKNAEIAKAHENISRKDEELKSLNRSAEESKTMADQLKTEKEDASFEKDKLEKKVVKLESEKKSLVDEKEQLLSEKVALVTDQQKVEEEKRNSQSRILGLEEEKQKLLAQSLQLKAKAEELVLVKKKADEEHEKLMKERSEFQAELQKRDLKLEDLAREIEKVCADCKKERERAHTAEEESKKHATISQDLETQLATSTNKFKELGSRLEVIEAERQALKLQVAKLKEVQQEKLQLEEKFKAMNTQIEDLRKSNSKLSGDFEAERASLRKNIEAHTLELRQKETELKETKNQVESLEFENVELKIHQSTAQNLEQEKNNLEKRVQQLEKSLAESEANANVISKLDSGDPAVVQLQQARESAEGQIDFLNSVIVDMQRKNEELQARLEAMESGGIINGSEDISYELSPHKTAAPRLFCDICDEFDLHDTDDCPQQAMSESPPASQFHGNRNDQRPYCDTCEVFGHWTASCDDEQTF